MSTKTLPPIVDAATWDAARLNILQQEKAVTHARDALAAARRRLPIVEVTQGYNFVGPEGPSDLPGLFAGFDQLIVYHHMLKIDDPAPCPGCCMFADNVGHLAHLNARNTRFVMISRAPIEQINAFKQRMGWTMPWYSTLDNFNRDFSVTNGFGLNVFCVMKKEFFAPISLLIARRKPLAMCGHCLISLLTAARKNGKIPPLVGRKVNLMNGGGGMMNIKLAVFVAKNNF